jgi:hypothetical protein
MKIKMRIISVLFILIVAAPSVGIYAQDQSDSTPKVLKVIKVTGNDSSTTSYLISPNNTNSVFNLSKDKLQQKKPSVQPVSIVSGSISTAYDYDGGVKQYWIVLNPVFMSPIGDKFFFQASVELQGTITPADSLQEWEKKIEFLHFDYFATKNLTVAVGAFLTPLGIYNERLDPRWIRNLQNEPYSHQDLYPESQLGFMLRGGIKLVKDLDFGYAAYYSFQPSPDFWVEAQRGAGGRIGLFQMSAGIEAGFSYYHKMVYDETNVWAVDFSFKYPRFPLAPLAKTYWGELNYKFTNIPDAPLFVNNIQIAARYEDLSLTDEGISEGMNNLGRFIVGLNYYIIDGFKLSAEYGTTNNKDNNIKTNLFTLGLVYRPVF